MGRKVLIIWVPVGGGHQTAMQSVTDAIADLDPTVELSNLNVYTKDYAAFLKDFHRLYPIIALRYPFIWGFFWHLLNIKPVSWMVDRTGRLLAKADRLGKALELEQPDLVVSIAPLLGNYIHDGVRAWGRNVPIAVVVVDMVAIHQGWIFKEAVWTSVPTEAARDSVIQKGLPPDKVYVCGMPIRKGFWNEPPDRDVLRRTLNLPQDKKVVLLVGGGDGASNLYDFTMALLKADLPYYYVVITGRNQALCEKLARSTQDQPCTVNGYTTNMADWMWASDLLVTKAGPNSIAEGMQCGLPLILTGGIIGQETANMRFVEENGLGIVATKPDAVVKAVQRILEDPAAVAEIKKAIRRVHPAHAAHNIAQLIIDTLPE